MPFVARFAAVAAFVLVACGREALPPSITVEDVTADLVGGFEPSAVVAARPDAPISVTSLTPGEWIRGAGPRPALAMPPPARVRYRVTAPPHAILRFGAGVGGVTRREPGRSAVRFAVVVDGVERWSQVVNPSATRHDRRWFDGRLDLGGETERPIEVELVTAPVDPALPLEGVAGWSRVELARASTYPRQHADPARPNVLVLLVDTLRADRVGRAPTLTPNLDALAARGVAFERAYAQASWTLQSIPSLMTGLVPQSHGVVGDFWGDAHDDDAASDAVPDQLETWAEAAARAGVTTVGVSANPLVSEATNLAQGFETFHEFGYDAQARNYASADDVNRVFLDWVHRHHDLRFVGYLHYMEPHDPYRPPRALRPPVPAGLPDALVDGWLVETARRINFKAGPKLPEPWVAYLRGLYDGEVRTWDAALATLLRGLDREGVLASTVIVVTADHGEEFQEHGFLRHGQTLHEEELHVPLVIAGPGVPVARRTTMVQGIDLYPTLARLLGFAVPPGLRGRDLLAERPDDAEIVSETSHAVDGTTNGRAIALRTPRWALLEYPATSRFELFDLASDPAEEHDRFAAEPIAPALVARLASLVAAAPPPPRAVTHGGDVRQRLKALGYTD